MNAVEKARLTRASKAVEAAVEIELTLAEEYATIDDMIERVYAAYDAARRKAVRTDADEDWHRAEHAMNVCLNVSARKRVLAHHFGEIA